MRIKQLAVLALAAYLVASAATFSIMAGSNSLNMKESNFAMLCVAGVYPSAARGVEAEQENSDKNPILKHSGEAEESQGTKTAEAGKNDENDSQTESGEVAVKPTVTDSKQPLVIIYHTHATEAYRPIVEGNFRTTAQAGSVREVGAVLAAELEKQGISVIHDQSLHDAESYNQSYSRSLETINGLLKKYPTAKYVIDLHRDAAAYMGNVGKTLSINGEVAATYALVVGMGNYNASTLSSYASTVAAKSGEMYSGFDGKIINKTYKYNQYVSDRHLLLEVGNNQNNIDEAKVTAKYFAKVLAAVIAEET